MDYRKIIMSYYIDLLNAVCVVCVLSTLKYAILKELLFRPRSDLLLAKLENDIKQYFHIALYSVLY